MQQSQQQSLIKRLTKIGLLLSIKESYLFSKNSLGLLLHPFKTLRGLRREKDRSQQLLLLGWPVYVLGVGLAGVYMGRGLLATTVKWGMARHSPGKLGQSLAVLGIFIPKLLVVVGWTLVVIALLLGGYLGYWVLRVWSADWRDKKVE